MTVEPITTKEAIAKQVQSLIANGVPGDKTQSKIEFLLDNYPHFKAKEIAEVLKIKTSYVHTAKHAMLKRRKSNGAQPTPVIQNQSIDISAPDPAESYKTTYNEPYQPEIWVEERYDYVAEPPSAPMQPQRMAAPTSLSASASSELNLISVDGMTLKLLMNVIYGNIDDTRKYKAFIKIEE